MKLSTLLIIPNIEYANMAHPNIEYANMAHPNMEDAHVAHPNMEDAHVAPLNKPDGGFPDLNIIIVMSKSTGVARFGPKINQNQHLGLGSGSHGLQELKKRVPGPKTDQKNPKIVPPGPYRPY